MRKRKIKNWLSVKELVIYILVILLGLIYVFFVWQADAQQQKDKVLQIARSVVASLTIDELKQMGERPEDIRKNNFPNLKSSLQKVIQVTPHARFAYFYVERDGKLYFVVDSEPETSPDYSPPGQEFTEADPVDKMPFANGLAQVTNPVTDRWGTWVSAEVPVFDQETHQIIAVFGMDYNANSWRNRIIFEVLQSFVMVVVILVLLILSRQSIRKNLLLLKEMEHREKMEKNLIESEQTLSNLVANLPGLIYRCALDENYTMEFISDACFRITGYAPEDFIANKRISFNDLILHEYRIPIWEKWQKVMNERSVFEEEYPIHTASGEIKWVWERGRCVFDANNNLRYLEGYIEDVTKRKRAENELRKLSRAIEQNPVSVVITDSKGNIEYTNPRFTEITGFEPHESIGQNPRILKSGKMSPEYYTNMWETISSGKVWKGEFINKSKTGRLYWASKSISPIIDEKGEITHFVAIGEDISMKKDIENELIKAKEKAEESDRLKSIFLANISHEIRTPMNGILGFAELLKEPDLAPDNQKEYLEVIESSGLRMLNIINDLMDISKIEAGETILRFRKTNVNKMIHELQLFFMLEGGRKNINIDAHCPLPEDECIIETDSTKLNQVLTNLIKNAVKFTERGAISFGYRLKDTKLEFYVSDTGPGIPPDQRELIFERFRQSTLNHLSRKYEGAGLGLAISKAYVGLLGGSIWIESELGKGSTFFFDLPYKSPSVN